MTKKYESILYVIRETDELPLWALKDETTQEEIDRRWNKGRKNKYFKPPENEKESNTYAERYATWQAMWKEIEG